MTHAFPRITSESDSLLTIARVPQNLQRSKFGQWKAPMEMPIFPLKGKAWQRKEGWIFQGASY